MNIRLLLCRDVERGLLPRPIKVRQGQEGMGMGASIQTIPELEEGNGKDSR